MASSDQSRTLWLVAQSNVAVKNIAEKLAKEDFLDFKILVSKDFHFDWHEHLYEKIERNLIVSEVFTNDTAATSRLLLGSRVILCTLSMLSNNKIAAFTQIVPLQTVIFDEASQIEVGDYFPMLSRYRATISKLVFIGDDKQHRMPIVIGNFISKHVYGNRLKTIHKITSNNSCRFVDVEKGKEKRVGQSWTNQAEISTAIQIARYFNSVGHSYRIVTPYDPQRSQLELALKKAKLPWEDKCFNVDSFQGNEEDYIIISLVRSEKIGFLRERRRVNVMLTRCKVRMVICTSRAFLEQIASDSLVGLLAASLGEGTWINWRDTLQPDFTI
ncbi:AAA domain-containing protein [Crucibulum laeve]|uniref:AAA domain-containing protein n=1 Tax=Crucibulum laeve TaxID=68775 RepID=A0A5C3LMP8_9AGAR|nr:AAA domain-containing protein [Crucibulum laeve]